jgi:tetratricopeptide (TPR) repeat protein/predicted Ser/Thr protein kinase/TolB-like protein
MAEPQAARPKSTEALPDLTGTTVGRFVIRARLGSGGMGEVYRADDTKLKRSVALKRMSPKLRTDEHYRQRFLKEAERASCLSDQRVAGIYDVLEENGETFLVMEYVEGSTLRSRLTRPFSLEEFLPVAIQCAEALVAAHEKGVVHRDIKPENIMLTPKGQVKILDFGVAKRLVRPADPDATASTVSQPGTLSGTPAYMAPEVLLEKESDARADIFSLGIVCYEMLTAQHPFRADSFLATSDRILHETPTPPSKLNSRVPERLERIVLKMLAKKAGERYARAAELLADLQALQGSGEIVEPPLARVWKWARKHNRVGVGVALLVAAVVVWLVIPRPPVERVRVAVLPFKNQTGDARLDAFRLTLTQILVLDLTGSPNIQVLPYERLVEITRGFEREGKDISSPEALQAISSYSNSRFLVVPTMFAVGSALRVSAEFRDAQTLEAAGAARVEHVRSGPAEETLYSMLDELANQIQVHFRKVSRGEVSWPRPEVSRPKTVMAGFHYTEGKNAFAQGNFAQALNAFERVTDEDPTFALAYARMGQIYGMLGYDDKARALSEKAAQLIRPETPVIAAYFIQANLGERKYDYAAAEEKYLELIRLYRDDPESYASLAAAYAQQAQYQKAISYYQQALARDRNYIVAYQELGSLYAKTGDFSQAVTYEQKALGLYRALFNREGEANASIDLGEVYRQKGEYQQARGLAESAWNLCQTLRNEFGALRALKLLGDTLFSAGDLEQARRTYEQILSTSGEIRNNRLVAQTLMNIGVSYHQGGELTKAAEYYERSLQQARRYGEYRDWPRLRERAQALTNLGSISIEYGPDPEKGLKNVQEALAIFQSMGDTAWVANNQMLVGLYYMNAGRYDEAMTHLRLSLGSFRSIDAKPNAAQALYNLARCDFLQNQYERTLDSLGKALELSRAIQDPFRVAMVQILLGWTYSRLGETVQARSLLNQGIQTAQEKKYGELLPDAYNALGEVYRESGEPDRARKSFQQGAALWSEASVSESSGEALSNLGLLEAEQGNFERGLTCSRDAVGRARRLQHAHTLGQALTNLARVRLLRKEYATVNEILGELSAFDERALGPELSAQVSFIKSRALEGLGKSKEAKASYHQAQQAIRTFQQSLSPNHRESFAKRRDVQLLLR